MTSSLERLVATIVPAGPGGPSPATVAEAVRRHLERAPLETRLAVWAGARVLGSGRVSPDRLAAGPPGVAAAVEALKALVLLARGAEQFAADLAERSGREPPARPDPPLTLVPSDEWDAGEQPDVVVVGSGAGGAMAARTLARGGRSVVVLEEGEHHPVEELRTGHPLHRFADLYRHGGTTAALGLPPIALPMGRAVGGSTVVNSGTCYRTPPDVLRHWRDDHGWVLADPGHFEPLLSQAEALLQVAPAPLGLLGRNGHLLLEGAARMGWAARPLDRNAPGCGGCCQCALGCPRNAKFGVHLNALPDACAAGARIVTGARAERIVHQRGRARGVAVRSTTSGRRFVVAADAVVVAAGAVGSPALLAASGLARHPRAGRNLALHPALGTAGLFSDEVRGWEGILQSAAVEEHHHRGLLIEATSTPPGMGTMILPGYGSTLLRWLEQADHVATMGAMISDGGHGRVRTAGRRTVVTYRVPGSDHPRLLDAIEQMARLLFAAGATRVVTGVPGSAPVDHPGRLGEALAAVDVRRLHLAAFHPTGTLAAGSDPQRHPVDPDGRLRGVDGVWVADASLLPSCPTVNPQLSILAAAGAVAGQMPA